MLNERQKIVIDELTPMFIAMINELSPQKRKILAATAILNGIVTAKEVAKEARVSVHTTSSVLGRLVKEGFLVDYSVHACLKRYTFSYKHEWLSRWLRVRRTGNFTDRDHAAHKVEYDLTVGNYGDVLNPDYHYKCIITETTFVIGVVWLLDFCGEVFPMALMSEIKIDVLYDDLVLTYKTKEKLRNFDQFRNWKKEREEALQVLRKESLSSTLADDILEGTYNPLLDPKTQTEKAKL